MKIVLFVLVSQLRFRLLSRLTMGRSGVIRGDINGDGQLDTADVKGLASYVLGKRNRPRPRYLEQADVNGDGHIDSRDLERLARFLNGTSRKPPAPITRLRRIR